MINSQFQDQIGNVQDDVPKKSQMLENQMIDKIEQMNENPNKIIEDKSQQADQLKHYYEKIIEEKDNIISNLKKEVESLKQQKENQLKCQDSEIDRFDSLDYDYFQEIQLEDIYQNAHPQPKNSIKIEYDKNLSQSLYGTVEICLLVDTTQSMILNKPFIIDAIQWLEQGLKSQFTKIFKWAVLTYKDYQQDDEYQPYPYVDFLDDITVVQELIEEQIFYGAADLPKDLKNGLNLALKLDWKSMNKIIIILTDDQDKYFKSKSLHDYIPNEYSHQLNQIISQQISFICVSFEKQYDLFKEFIKFFNQKNCSIISLYIINENLENQKNSLKQQENFVLFVIQFLKDTIKPLRWNKVVQIET